MKIFTSLVISLLLFSGCSSYVDRLHNQMDQEYRQEAQNSSGEDGSNDTPSVALSKQYRQRRFQRPHRRPRQGQGRNNRQGRKGLSSAQTTQASPSIQRKYSSSKEGDSGRTKAEDLRDSGNNASLWSSNEGHLFYQDTTFKNGDIVLINVMDKLKDEITLELRRAFPQRQQAKKNNDEGENNTNQEGGDQQGGNNNQQEQAQAKIHDRISSVVVEEVNEDHLLLRGRKELLYRNRKRLIEIQALVAKRDIDTNDSVNSDQIIEKRINVLR